MPEIHKRHVPVYRLHRGSGQAVVTINGRDHYLGPHGSEASKLEYDRRIAEWLANDRNTPSKPEAQLKVTRCESGSRRLDVAEFIEFCVGCGVDPSKAIKDLMSRRR